MAQFALSSVECPTCKHRMDMRGVAQQGILEPGQTVGCDSIIVVTPQRKILPPKMVQRQDVRRQGSGEKPEPQHHDYVPPSERPPIAAHVRGRWVPIGALARKGYSVRECKGEILLMTMRQITVVTVRRA